jgi:hypothetical protein
VKFPVAIDADFGVIVVRLAAISVELLMVPA